MQQQQASDSSINDLKESQVPSNRYLAFPYKTGMITRNNIVLKQVSEVNEEEYGELLNLLTQGTSTIISPGDKVYILPGYSVSRKRLETYIKNSQAHITKDVKRANVIFANKSLEDKDDWLHRTKLFYYLARYAHEQNEVHELFGLEDDVKEITMKLIDGSFLDLSANETLYYERRLVHWNRRGYNISGVHLVDPIVYHIKDSIESKSIKIIHEDDIITRMGSQLVIDEYNYSNLRDSITRGDGNSLAVGVQTLSGCNIEESMPFIIRLFRSSYWKVVGSGARQYKNFRAFEKIVDSRHIFETPAIKLIEEYKRDGKLTKEVFKELESEVRADLKSSLEEYTKIYNFKVQIKPELHEFVS